MSNTTERSRRWRGVWLRLAAIGIGLSPFVVGEFVLRLGGWGMHAPADDPFVAIATSQPLFELSGDGRQFEIRESRQRFFRPESFPAAKPANSFRIFCLGGSTVQGRPFAIETSFTSWLELSLRAADPSRDWDVVNCGGVSYASYRLAPVLTELLEHEPDMFILYTGHNEFLEERTYRVARQAPRWAARVYGTLSRLRTYNLARSWFVTTGPPSDRPVMKAEVDALLDYRGGLEDYDRDDVSRQRTVEHFEFNLRKMIRAAADAGVPVVLVNPVSDLSNTPPFKSTNRDGISATERTRFMAHWDDARAIDASAAERVAALQRAIAIDRRHGSVHFMLGRLHEESGRVDLAKAAYLRAKDEDVCPLRMPESLHEVVRRVGGETSATMIDARELFERSAATPIPGEEWLIDHVHPTIAGHQAIATALLSNMVERSLVTCASGWKRRRDRSYVEHFRSLPPDYYLRGRQRLDGLKRWSEGRALGIRVRPR